MLPETPRKRPRDALPPPATADSPAPYAAPDGFGDYMVQKMDKLHRQFAAEHAPSRGEHAQFFRGVRAYINGRTDPPLADLKVLLGRHGGTFEQYETSRVTHTIADNLTDQKIKLMTKTACVVRAAWVVACCREQRLLPVGDFLLVRPGPGIQTIRDVFTTEASEASSARAPPGADQSIVDRSSRARALSTAGGDQAGFIANYYNSSRLHHLSTLRLRLQREHAEGHRSGAGAVAGERIIVHVDLDCFFASVALRSRPELADQPVVVCHSKGGANAKSGDIACASYAARKFGVRNGMWMRQARELCPGLVTVPYLFDEYEEVSGQVFQIFGEYTQRIQPLSCDEAYLDMSHHQPLEHVEELVREMRQRIVSTTGCPASAGIGPSIFLARIATKLAKPDGQRALAPGPEAQELIAGMRVRDLPGVGWSTDKVLKARGVDTCRDLLAWSVGALQAEFGAKHGQTLYNFCRGIDTRELQCAAERKSVGTEISWGVRFKIQDEVDEFIERLSDEVSSRLKEASLVGSAVTLKLKIRSADAPVDPPKFLGHGRCTNHSRSGTLRPARTDSASSIAVECKRLFRLTAFPPDQVRGVGITVTKLVDPAAPDKSGSVSIAAALRKMSDREAAAETSTRVAPAEPPPPPVAKLPSQSALDVAELEKLPQWLQNEIRDEYRQQREHTRPKKQPRSVRGAATTTTATDSLVDESVLKELPPSVVEDIMKNERLLQLQLQLDDAPAPRPRGPVAAPAPPPTPPRVRHPDEVFASRESFDAVRRAVMRWARLPVVSDGAHRTLYRQAFTAFGRQLLHERRSTDLVRLLRLLERMGSARGVDLAPVRDDLAQQFGARYGCELAM